MLASDILMTAAKQNLAFRRERGEDALADDKDYLGDLFATFRGMVMFPGGGNVGIYPDNGIIGRP